MALNQRNPVQLRPTLGNLQRVLLLQLQRASDQLEVLARPLCLRKPLGLLAMRRRLGVRPTSHLHAIGVREPAHRVHARQGGRRRKISGVEVESLVRAVFGDAAPHHPHALGFHVRNVVVGVGRVDNHHVASGDATFTLEVAISRLFSSMND